MANSAIQSLVESDSEVPGLVPYGREPAGGQERRRQQGQEGEPVFPQEPDVHFEPFTRRRGGPSIKQPEPTALNQNPELGPLGLAVREEEAFRGATLGVYPREVTGLPFGMNQGNRPALVASKIPAPGELLDRVAEFAQDMLPGVDRFDRSDFLAGRLPSSRVALEAVLEGVAGQEPIDSEAIATDPGEVVGDAADRIESRELRDLMKGVRQKLGADRLDWSFAVGGAQDADAVGVLGVVGDQQVRSGGPAHALLPAGAHEGVAGSLGLSYFDWADGDGSCGAGSGGEGAGGALFGQVVEECGCGHGRVTQLTTDKPDR